MKISGFGGICHMSDVTDVKISGDEVTFRALDIVARGLLLWQERSDCVRGEAVGAEGG